MFFIGLNFAAFLQDLVNVDYESEVEDDMIPIFRKGEVTHILANVSCDSYEFLWGFCSFNE